MHQLIVSKKILHLHTTNQESESENKKMMMDNRAIVFFELWPVLTEDYTQFLWSDWSDIE